MKKLSDLIPGGSHTYSKGDDCFPSNAPEYLVKGEGAYTWDNKGKKYLDYGMGLRSVILGHSFDKINHAVIEALMDGVNFTRPNLYEKQLAELMLDIFPWYDNVKFGKSGSDATSAAVKLARAYTGRNIVLVANENPFISQHDWYMGLTYLNSGTIGSGYTMKYSYNDLENSLNCFDLRDVAAIILDPATVDITKEKLQYIRAICNKYGIIMIMDEIISGFRYGLTGVQGLFDVHPDLSTFGKAMGNGFSVSALCGKRDMMRLGDREYGNVFLLSGTYNGNVDGLAAAIATITELRDNPSILQHINHIGRVLVKEFQSKINSYELNDFIKVKCFEIDGSRVGSNPSISFSDMVIKTIFDQHMTECRTLMPYIAPSFSHSLEDVENTINAADYAMKMIVNALKSKNPANYCMNSHIEKAVFRRKK